MAALIVNNIIRNATIISVSKRGPPEVTTGDIAVDDFTSGGRRVLSVDCTAADHTPVFSGGGAPVQRGSSISSSVKNDPEKMTADELAFYRQVKDRSLEIKDEEGEMNLMDTDEKIIGPHDVSRMTRRFEHIGNTPGIQREDVDDYLGQPTPGPDSPDGLFIDYLKEIVRQDLQRPSSERIDTVRIKSPERHHWLALDGLSPKHLTLVACNDEIGDLTSLDNLQHRWTELETLRLEDVSDLLWDKEDWATTVSSVKAITLAYCSSLRLRVEGGLPNLTKLRILENDAMALFVRAGMDVPGFSKRLQVLYLQSTNGCDARSKTDLMRFRDRLRKCNHLNDLTLILARADQDTGLAPYLPSSIETLVFHCSCSLAMLSDLEDWLKKPADRKWLSNLKSFTFKCDARTFDRLAIRTEENRTRGIQDVPVPPIAVKHEGDATAEASTDVEEGDSMDIADLNARRVLEGDDFDEDEDDDGDYEDEGADAANDTDEDDTDEDMDEDEEMIKEEDDDDAQLDFGARDDHNSVLLPHITSMITSVLMKMKARNPELQIAA